MAVHVLPPDVFGLRTPILTLRNPMVHSICDHMALALFVNRCRGTVALDTSKESNGNDTLTDFCH